MTSPWEHPPLCVCPACSSRRETALRKRVEVLEAEVERLTREREDYREKRANEVDTLRARAATLEAALHAIATGLRWEEELSAWVLTDLKVLTAAHAALAGKETP